MTDQFDWPPMQPITPDAFVTSVYDGDTVIAHVRWEDSDGGIHHDRHIRLEGIQAIELRAKWGAETANAAARIFVDQGAGGYLIERRDGHDYRDLVMPVHVTLVHRRAEKFGRLLARILLPDGTSFGDRMLLEVASDGITPLARPYIL